ncbi:unnamed protein product [Tuber aestivum]|uniref:Ubiquitin-like-conjugating enzyme ATG10 n=1 Tax=Tuber aestivum TaxID=59557 RepID=A0A292Q3Z8_9PEZI|nr:unnamed protein product [Tuber aestivum]
MPDLQNFPFISPEEFAEGCARLGERLQKGGIGEAMLSHEVFSLACVFSATAAMGVTNDDGGGRWGVRELVAACAEGEGEGDGNEREDEDEKVQNGGVEEDEDEDEDDESLPPVSPSRWKVEYQILLSRAYQLPILYFNLHPPSSTAQIPASLQQVYEKLTSATTRDALKSVGVQGAISQTDHPVLGVPYYFVHPCNTAAAMGEWQLRRRDWGEGREDFDAEKYLAVWIGVVGSAVGLFLPSGCMA